MKPSLTGNDHPYCLQWRSSTGGNAKTSVSETTTCGACVSHTHNAQNGKYREKCARVLNFSFLRQWDPFFDTLHPLACYTLYVILMVFFLVFLSFSFPGECICDQEMRPVMVNRGIVKVQPRSPAPTVGSFHYAPRLYMQLNLCMYVCVCRKLPLSF